MLNINKPAGWTSHDVVARVRRLVGQKRVGHTGTLDPLATGVLPVLLGRATRLAELVQSGRKRYRGVASLGAATTTDDAQGEVVARLAVPPLTTERIEATVQVFRGEILQTPPRYSAVKLGGQRAYALARRGSEVALAPRRVTVYDLQARLAGERELQLDVTCSSGTYIRALARDLAVALGTVGHLSALQRIQVGPFALDEALTLDDIASRGVAASLLSAARVLPDAPEVDVTFEDVARLCNGQPVPLALPASEAVWVYDPDRTLVCLGTTDGILLRSRLLL